MENEVDLVISTISRQSVDFSRADYRELLKRIIDEVKTMLDASENDD